MGDRTIDELAREAELPASTVRLYQSRGLLPPPRLEGRVGRYDDGHLARLRLIARLQEQGFSLAAIRHLVEAWSSGRGLSEVLGVGTGVEEEPLELTPTELAEVFAGVELTGEVLGRAVALGLVTLENGAIRVPNPAYLRLGSEIASLGIPVSDVLDEYEHLRETTGSIADRFVALFERHILEPGCADGFGPEQVAEVTATFERLRRLASAIVDEVLRESLAARATARLAEEADRVAAAATTTRTARSPKRRR